MNKKYLHVYQKKIIKLNLNFNISHFKQFPEEMQEAFVEWTRTIYFN